MREILFLCHRIPFPPDRGDKIRSHHILKRLARFAQVHVATFADDDFDMTEEAELAALASTYKLVRRSKPLLLAGLQSLAARQPVSLSAFRDRSMSAYVENLLSKRKISTIYVFSGQMGQYVPESFGGRVIADFVDVDSAKFKAYAAKGSGLMNWVNAREGELLGAEEIRLAARADVSLFVARTEAELFLSCLPSDMRGKVDVRVLPNGIDSFTFDPILVGPETRMLDCPGPRLIFTGQMDYAPNVEAVTRVIERILPLIRRSLPDATFHVVGRNPEPELLDRHGRGGCFVWGRVNDIRPWLKAADLCIVPLEIARGVQNKVLEAMSMALPVVLTSEAATGIDAVDGQHFRIADSDEGLSAVACDLLTNVRRARVLGGAARRFVSENVSWQMALASLPDLVGCRGRAALDAA